MKRAVWIPVLALALAGIPAAASTFLALDREELVEQADAVVAGRVVEVTSFWNAEHTAILTEAVLEVEDTLVGSSPAYVNLRTFGGQVGNYRIVAHGFPTFQLGERLVLFLEPEQDGAQRVLGYQQGQYRIREQQGREMAVPVIDFGARILRPDGTEAPAPKAMPFADFKQQIRETAGRVGRPAVQ
ncbi:MAG: hypothetical protein ABUT39_21125 [Acidobacteriota bacterium]